MRKNIFLVFLLFFVLVIITGSLISAGCCEKTKAGLFCQNVEEQQCDGNSAFAPMSCDTSSFCKIGTCIKNGICSPNVAKASCDEEGGTWYDQDPLTIEICQPGCCLYGDQSAFVSQSECKQIATTHGVRTYFDYGIDNQNECYALANNQEEGACVVSSDYQTVCARKTKKECLDWKNTQSDDAEELLDFYSDSVEIDFFPGLLCTAEELGADNSPTKNTKCYEDKVYFVDSLGQRANVYDSSMDNNKDYWTKIQNSSCDIVTGSSSTCGNCDYGSGGTMCGEQGGRNVCIDLSCEYDTNNNGRIDSEEHYEHGESWCAETPGTYHHLPMDLEVGDEHWNKLTSLKGVSELYNIPGSSYMVLKCRNGEVLEMPCSPYRNSICMEQELVEEEPGEEPYRNAACVPNSWRNCYTITNKTTCEDLNNSFCKWLPGYMIGSANSTLNNRGGPDTDVILAKNSEIQGSCVPLFAPGFDFWNNSGNAEQGATAEVVSYETWWAGADPREDEEGNELNEDEGRNSQFANRENLPVDSQVASQRCFSQNCYVVPNYGDGISEEDWINIWDGEAGTSEKVNIKNYNYLSWRKGAYCHKNDDPDAPKVGGFTLRPACITSSDDPNKKIYHPPIFITHEDWITNLLLRTRSLGDVGYKKSISGQWGNPEVERVISQISKLNQDGDIKENMTEDFVMYEGGVYTDENKRMGEWIGKYFYELDTESNN